RRPVRPHVNRAWIPAPPEARAIEPPSVVERRPAPGLVRDPRPAIPINPYPAAVGIRRPAHRHAREPAGTIARHRRPLAVTVEVVRAVDARMQVAIALRAQQLVIATLVPAIPVIASRRADFLHLDLVIGGAESHYQHLAAMQRLGALAGGNFSL